MRYLIRCRAPKARIAAVAVTCLLSVVLDAQAQSPRPWTPTYSDEVDPEVALFLKAASGADAVVIATVDAARSYLTPDARMIYTEYRLHVHSIIQGSAPDMMTVIEEGGEVGEVGLYVSHAVRFEEHGLYALAVEQGPGSSEMAIRRGAEGVRRLEHPIPELDAALRHLISGPSGFELGGGRDD